MLITIRLLLLMLLVWLVLPTTASAFYNPSTGRWLSRDPRFEQGGLQLYIFVGNEPIGMYDYLGLSYDNPNWPPPIVPSKPYFHPNSPIYDCTCTCESVSVTYDPGGGGQPYLDYYYLGNAEQAYGSKVRVKWKVRGNPRKCEYFQDERNTTFAYVSPADAKAIKGKFEVVSQVYTDSMGIYVPFFSPPHFGTWLYWLNWDVTFICRSTDGSKVTRNDSAYLTGSFIYPNR